MGEANGCVFEDGFARAETPATESIFCSSEGDPLQPAEVDSLVGVPEESVSTQYSGLREQLHKAREHDKS